MKTPSDPFLVSCRTPLGSGLTSSGEMVVGAKLRLVISGARLTKQIPVDRSPT